MASDVLETAAQAILSIWHSYRVFLLLLVTATVMVVRLYQKRQRDIIAQTPTVPLPPPGYKAAVSKRSIPTTPTVVKGESKTESSIPASPPPAEGAKQSVAKPSKAGPKRVRGSKPVKRGRKKNGAGANGNPDVQAIQPIIFFASLTTTTERRANLVYDQIKNDPLLTAKASQEYQCDLLAPEIIDLANIDFDDYFVSPPKEMFPDAQPGTVFFYCIIVPSYDIDSTMNMFVDHLDETHNDFRVDTAPLRELVGYTVFGIGDTEQWPTEREGFCYQAKEVDKWMAKLTGRKRAYPLGLGDVKNDCDGALNEWSGGLREAFRDMLVTGGALGEGVEGSGDPVESDEEDPDDAEKKKKKKGDSDVQDVEDIKWSAGDKEEGDEEKAAAGGGLPIDFTTYSKKPAGKEDASPPAPKEMVPTTSPTYAALTKQGYTIVGSHSGVKICRWTKSALRGRGSCYKNSFYGIASHLCMETTPSLSCSNKCVFCWRHGTNPVGTTWRWKIDPPEVIFNGVKAGHYKKIKMLRGVPGIRAERFAEAMRIKHCALSLVGEPIFYPHINEFLQMLHAERISSFLVCNAQHPDQLAKLTRLTQLYVSIDASNKESLRKIDRPLNRDFWERLQECLGILREKRFQHRTVFRFTLVKGFNVEDETIGYADMIEQALPCFIEIKGVTYCGTSSSAEAGLTMKNVPFYEEIVAFVVLLNKELNRRGLGYGISAEHSHSCCILLASNRFLVNGKWHTRIDYEKFFELLEKENEDGTPFTPEDYMRETEEWALWGNGGFDPRDERVYTKGKNKGKKAVMVTGASMVVDED